jgi:hypothetical protein
MLLEGGGPSGFAVAVTRLRPRSVVRLAGLLATAKPLRSVFVALGLVVRRVPYKEKGSGRYNLPFEGQPAP